MHSAGGRRKAREVEVSFVGRIHNRSIRISNADRSCGATFVYNVCSYSTKMCGAAAVGDGREVGDDDGGGTYMSGR